MHRRALAQVFSYLPLQKLELVPEQF